GRAGTAAVRRRLTAARRRGVAPPVGRVPAAGTAARLPTAGLLARGPSTARLPTAGLPTAGLPTVGPPAEGRGRRGRRWRRGRRGGPGVTGRRDGCGGGSRGLSRGRGGLLRRAARRNTGKGAAEPELRSRADLFDDRVLLDLELQVEEVPDRLFLNAVHHGVEHVVALPLVLDQRVALRHRPQADALAEVVHLVQVLAPLAVEDRQDDAPLDLAHDLRREFGLTAVVGFLRVLLHHLGEQVRGQAALLAPGFVDHRLGLQRDREELLERPPELVEVPFLRVP